VVIDLLSQRHPFYGEVEVIFDMAIKGKLQLVVSSLTLATTSYILAKDLSTIEIRKVIRAFSSIVDISTVDSIIVDLALDDEGFLDFEDGLQHYSALSSNCEIIITRDRKDFTNSKLPVMNPVQFLATIN